MSESNEVKFTNKRTGEVSAGKSARSAMHPKSKKSSLQEKSVENTNTTLDIKTETKIKDDPENQMEEDINGSNTNKKVKKKTVKAKIKSLADFVAYAYSRKGQSLKSLAPGEIGAITKNAKLNENQFKELIELSRQDSLLAVPRQITFTAHEIVGYPIVRQEVRRFVSEVLKRHPVYQQNNLLAVISNLDNALDPLDAVRVLAKLSQDTLASLAGLEKPKPKECESLRSNAIYNLVVYLWESRGVQINTIIRWLQDGYWSLLAPSDANPNFLIRTLTDITEVSSTGVACAQFKEEADAQAARATRMQGKVHSLEVRIKTLDQSIQELNGQVKKRDETVRTLADELETEKSAHTNSRIHLGDDREHMRSSVVRRLKREVSLLTEGLQALRKDPPKYRVMDDHAERVLEGLHSAIRDLEEED